MKTDMAAEAPGPFADFRPWFTQVIEEVKPDLVVCIARSALRLVQLHQVSDVLGDVRVVTQHALPFISDQAIEDRRILIFDDSIIYGSTMSSIHAYLRSRGGIPTCAAYVADRVHFFGIDDKYTSPSPHATLPLRIKHTLPPRLVTQHHDALIQSVLTTPLEYNPDFSSAIFQMVRSDSSLASWIPIALRRYPLVRDVVEISSSSAAKNRIHRYTAFLRSPVPAIFSTDGVDVAPYSKFRLWLNQRTGTLKSTALAQVRLTDRVEPGNIDFHSDVLRDFWYRLDFPNHKGDAFWPQAIFRLATAFASTVLNSQLVRDLPTVLGTDYECTPGRFVSEDLSAILTTENANVLQALFDELVKQPELPRMHTPQSTADASPSRGPVAQDETLAQSIRELWKLRPQFAPDSSETSYEALAKVFLSLHEVTDTDQMRRSNPDVTRLDVGLTYSTIQSVLADRQISLEPDDLSVALDICIDHGQAVPRVLSQDGIWHRAFYSGEGRHSVDPLQFKALFYKEYAAHLQQNPTSPLSPFLLNKFCASLKDFFPRLPFSTKFRTYGKVALVGSEELVDWMSSSIGAPLKHVREGAVDCLRLNPNYLAAVDPGWTNQEHREFGDTFSFLAAAYTRAPSDAVVLLSTCRTHRHFYCAIAVEAHQWAEQARGFGDCLDELGNGLINGGDSHRALFGLYYACRYLQEIKRKTTIFSRRFKTLAIALRREFIAQGPSGARFWEYMIEGNDLLDEKPIPEIEDRLSILEPIVAQMTSLTSYTIRFLLDARLLDLSAFRRVFESQSASLEWDQFDWLFDGSAADAAATYNRFFTGKAIGRSFVQTQLEISDGSTTRATDQIQTVRRCYQELRSALHQLCPRYIVEEGNEFEFAPDCSKRHLVDGTIERYFPEQYILALDIIGSTDSDAGQQLKNNILAILDRNAAKGVKFATAADDKYVACHSSARVLWDLAVMIQVDGAMLASGKMAGTRKGLFFGGITLQEKPDGRVLLIDTVTPHVIPRAVGILEAAKSSALGAARGQNSVLVVDYFAGQRAAAELGLDLSSAEKIEHKSKHYAGSCYVLETISSP